MTWRRGIFLGLIVAVIAIRIAAPHFILKRVNATLATLSPIYQIHIGDLELSFLRMFYRFENIEGKLKQSGKKFLQIKHVDVSVAWSELFRGRVLTKVEVEEGRVIVSKALFQDSKTPEAKLKETAQGVVATLFPVDVSAVYLRRSDVRLGEMVGQPESDLWRIAELNGSIFNLIPSKRRPVTLFSLKGNVMKTGEFKSFGRLKRLEEPMAWQAGVELRKFVLPQINALASQYFPISFEKGVLDVFAQATSVKGKMRGYVKPFLKDVELMGDRKDFKTVKHFGVEVLGAIANAIVRRSEDKSVATRIEFFSDGGSLQVNSEKAVSKAIGHGFGQPLREGFDDIEVLN